MTIHIPDTLLTSLGGTGVDMSRAVMEGFAVESYRSGKLSTFEVRQLLGHSSRWETEDLLARHGAWPDPSEAEMERDLETLELLHAK